MPMLNRKALLPHRKVARMTVKKQPARGCVTWLVLLWLTCVCHAEVARNVKVVCDRWVDATSLRTLGQDAIRLENAATPQEKAIAVYRWVKRMLWLGSAPREYALPNSYVSDPIKIVNVYGYHWCDGQSRVMQCVWRALGGRAYKFFKAGHTLADIYYVDEDGVGRWHLFDLSQNWFTYDRSGARILSAGDITLWLAPRPADMPYTPYLSTNEVYGWVHAPHLPLESVHRMNVDLRIGERLVRRWYYAGVHYERKMNNAGQGVTDIEHGPYPADVGTGEFLYRPDFSRPGWENDLVEPPRNGFLQTHEGTNLFSPEPHHTTSLTWQVTSPYIIADAQLTATVWKEHEQDSIVVQISTDGGQTWYETWTAPEGFGEYTVDLCPREVRSGSPFGRYGYLIRIVLENNSGSRSVGIGDVALKTVVQQNIWALPQLQPGDNHITVSADVLPAGLAIRVTYIWHDTRGANRRSVAVIEHPPYTYSIQTAGRRWSDVICRELTVEVVPADGAGNRVVEQEPPITTEPPEPVYSNFGRPLPLQLKSRQYYEGQLASAHGNDLVEPLKGLMWLGDPAAAESIEEYVIYAPTWPKPKLVALRALAALQGTDSVPVLLKALRRDPSLHFGAGPSNEQFRWNHVPALAATLLARFGVVEAVPDIIDILENGLPYPKYHYYTTTWACLRALGDLRAAEAVPILVSYLNSGGTYSSDDAAVAARALGKIGEPSAAQALLEEFDSTSYGVTKINCAWALGRLKVRAAATRLVNMLSSDDEDFRATACEAIGQLRYAPALSMLEDIADEDPFAWVRAKAAEAATAIRRYLYGDLNADGRVDLLDLMLVINSWGQQEGEAGFDPLADLDWSGHVDLADLLTVVSFFGNVTF